MTQQSLVYPEGEPCRWCYDEAATTILYATPTGVLCAASTTRERVTRWLNAVARHLKGAA